MGLYLEASYHEKIGERLFPEKLIRGKQLKTS